RFQTQQNPIFYVYTKGIIDPSIVIINRKMNEHPNWIPDIAKYIGILALLFFGLSPAQGQERYTISGTITDKSNGETLFGATVSLGGTTIGGITNEYGFYSISAPQGTYRLNISYLGYSTETVEIVLDR